MRLDKLNYYAESSGTSFNSRIDKSTLQPCMFGSCLKRIANWAVATRRKHPSLKIFAQKVDIKSAYRRLHLNAALAIQTCTQLPELNLAIASLRATFGGTYGPYEWGVISESICDLANAILLNDDWDHNVVMSPDQELVPQRICLDDNIPFGQGKELIVDIPIDPRGMVDVYIDDLIGLTVEIPNSKNVARLERATLLALHTIARPVHPDEPIPRTKRTYGSPSKTYCRGRPRS